jgi:hypothetical protein
MNVMRLREILLRSGKFATRKLAVLSLIITLLLAFSVGAQRGIGSESNLSMGTPTPEPEVVHEAFPERVPIDTRPVVQQTPVSLNLAGAFQEGRNVHDLGPVSAEQIVAADKAFADKFADVHPGPLRVGLVRSLGAFPLSIEGGSALRIPRPDGGNVWTLAIRSPGAFGMRIHFINFDVGDGAALVYAHDADGVIVRGPYTRKGPRSSGEFWTASLPGDMVFIEVSGSERPRLEVDQILHFDKHPAGLVQGDMVLQQLGCHLDVMCHDVMVRDAVGQMNFTVGGEGVSCTGTLLTDLDDETFVPYFLTARHCISTQAVADTLEVVWFWQRDSCGGALPNYDALPRNNGSTLLETSSENDMSFLRLDGGLPGGVVLAGWTTGHPDEGYGIHHPGHPPGNWKRVTFLSDVGFCPGCVFCGDTGDYDYYNMDSGIIERGSSGSGIFNSAGQLAGHLSGDCDLYPPDDELSCDNVDDFVAQYGEFETTYPIIRRWLEIGGTIHVDGSYSGREEGTPTKPFNTVNEANNFAWDGARIKIQAGSYPETLVFTKTLTVLATGGTVTIGE